MNRSVFLLALPLALAACGGNSVTKTLGLSSNSPDEFTVTTRAPLSVPPDLQAANLPAPAPGTSRPQEQPLTTQAQQTLEPQLALNPVTGQNSPGQQALVAQAGPAAPGDIRKLVGADAVADEKVSFTQKVEFWSSNPVPGAVVDAAAESARLQKNAALGKGATDGATPVIDRGGKKKFLWIF